ncbi:MAG: hypothetical protein QOH88_1502 [Verrucomicrobiota bacterium]|jgi:hypothetical protein
MLPLHTATFPSSATELARLLNESLQRVFIGRSDAVTIRANSYPHLDALQILLDGAKLSGNPPPPPAISGKTSSALQIDELTLRGSPILVDSAAVTLSLAARQVHLRQGKDANDQIVLSLESAADGNIEISLDKSDLEALLTELAKSQAGKQGVTIESVQLELRQKNPRSVAAEVSLRARKLFLSATIQVTGQLDLDDQLNLKMSGLRCEGFGGMGTMACGVLGPHLQKLDGREFPLLALPLGEVRLRDVQLSVGDRVSVRAEFGSAA